MRRLNAKGPAPLERDRAHESAEHHLGANSTRPQDHWGVT